MHQNTEVWLGLVCSESGRAGWGQHPEWMGKEAGISGAVRKASLKILKVAEQVTCLGTGEKKPEPFTERTWLG